MSAAERCPNRPASPGCFISWTDPSNRIIILNTLGGLRGIPSGRVNVQRDMIIYSTVHEIRSAISQRGGFRGVASQIDKPTSGEDYFRVVHEGGRMGVTPERAPRTRYDGSRDFQLLHPEFHRVRSRRLTTNRPWRVVPPRSDISRTLRLAPQSPTSTQRESTEHRSPSG